MVANILTDAVENPMYPLVFLGLTLAFVLAGYAISRAKPWLYPVLPILLVAGGLVLADYLIFSPKERVTVAIEECVVAVGGNQVEPLLKHIAPALRAEVEAVARCAFALVECEHAYANDVKLTENFDTTPRSIQATFFAGVKFKSRKEIIPMERYVCILTVNFQEFESGEWLITSYTEREIIGSGNL